MSEILYTCPVCQIPNFTATGLHRHQCHAKPDRAKLTLIEIAAAPVSAPVPTPTKTKGGAS